VDTHEAFRRAQVVMGMVKDGRVVFGNEADRQRLIKSATATKAK
jgi:branched-chain amino acid transport system substrate-binding protein